MKERITFIETNHVDTAIEQLNASKKSLQIKAPYAAREEQLTFAWDELPQEVYFRSLSRC